MPPSSNGSLSQLAESDSSNNLEQTSTTTDSENPVYSFIISNRRDRSVPTQNFADITANLEEVDRDFREGKFRDDLGGFLAAYVQILDFPTPLDAEKGLKPSPYIQGRILHSLAQFVLEGYISRDAVIGIFLRESISNCNLEARALAYKYMVEINEKFLSPEQLEIAKAWGLMQ